MLASNKTHMFSYRQTLNSIGCKSYALLVRQRRRKEVEEEKEHNFHIVSINISLNNSKSPFILFLLYSKILRFPFLPGSLM